MKTDAGGAAMTYVALLRGINVGGNAAVDMRTLKAILEGLGLDDVRTYINSGNVVFSSSAGDQAALCRSVEGAIVTAFGLQVPVLLLSAGRLTAIADAVPATWVNDASMKCDVFFLWPDADRPSVVDDVPHNSAIEDLLYVPGALIRRIDKKDATKSPLNKLVGSRLYRQMTARNINTVRKLRTMAAPDQSGVVADTLRVRER